MTAGSRDGRVRERVASEGLERRRFLLGACGALGATVAGAAGLSTFVRRSSGSPAGFGGRGAPSTAGPPDAPSTTIGRVTRATVPEPGDPLLALVEPQRPPADPYADVPVRAIGRISIPRIGLEHEIYEGIWLTVLNVGPGHWPGSAMPGQLGNTVFPGHRVTYSRPFYRLDELAAGDEITFTTANGTFTYAQRETLIVSPKDLWVVDRGDEPEVTLIACHPRGSARQRIVAKGGLVRSLPSAATVAAAAEIAEAAARLPL